MYFNYSMKKELELVAEFHQKFAVPLLSKPSLIPQDRSNHRHKLMSEEVAEYKAGVANEDLENIAKELADVLFATYGTILEHGLQDKMEEIFAEVHRSNMSKDFHEYKMIKGKSYTPANIADILSK
jgi:predicted HAD superfamily Cof-like phosphohydrolase